MYHYILVGDNYRAVPVKSELLHDALAAQIRAESSYLHGDSNDTIYRIGAVEIVNPRLMFPGDFTKQGCYIL